MRRGGDASESTTTTPGGDDTGPSPCFLASFVSLSVVIAHIECRWCGVQFSPSVTY